MKKLLKFLVLSILTIPAWLNAQEAPNYSEIEAQEKANMEYDTSLLKAFKLLETPDNKKQFDAASQTLRQIEEVRFPLQKAATDMNFLKKRGKDDSGAYETWLDLVGKINKLNEKFSEQMRTIYPQVDRLIAEGKIDMRPYSPENVEKLRREMHNNKGEK
jgi:hypothetical protein